MFDRKGEKEEVRRSKSLDVCNYLLLLLLHQLSKKL